MLRSWAADDQLTAIVTTRTADKRLNHVFMNATYNTFLSDDKAPAGSERVIRSFEGSRIVFMFGFSCSMPRVSIDKSHPAKTTSWA